MLPTIHISVNSNPFWIVTMAGRGERRHPALVPDPSILHSEPWRLEEAAERSGQHHDRPQRGGIRRQHLLPRGRGGGPETLEVTTHKNMKQRCQTVGTFSAYAMRELKKAKTLNRFTTAYCQFMHCKRENVKIFRTYYVHGRKYACSIAFLYTFIQVFFKL